MEADLTLTRAQVRRIDELAQREYGLPGIILMENAGCGAAAILDRVYGPRGSALVVCGTGNNGGDGLVVARHLHNRQWKVQVIIVGTPEAMTPDCSLNDHVIQRMQIPRIKWAADPDFAKDLGKETVVVDAILGTGFRGQVRPQTAALIEQLNNAATRATVALDVPSGLDCDTGLPGGTAIQADLTITFVALKPGFLTESGQRHTGECHVVDIGVPKELIARVAIQG